MGKAEELEKFNKSLDVDNELRARARILNGRGVRGSIILRSHETPQSQPWVELNDVEATSFFDFEAEGAPEEVVREAVEKDQEEYQQPEEAEKLVYGLDADGVSSKSDNLRVFRLKTKQYHDEALVS